MSDLVRGLRRPGVVLSALVLAVLLVAAIAPGLFTAVDPLAADATQRMRPPGVDHVFGTDRLGRDLFARVVWATGPSIMGAAIALAVALAVGIALGTVAGYFGGMVDDVISRVADVLLSIPNLLLSLALVTALGFGTGKVAVAVGISAVAPFTRIMRTEVTRIRSAPYIEAAHTFGSPPFAILRRHVLPAAAPTVLGLATLEFGVVVLAVSSLSFLGFGTPPPAPEWGSLVADGRNYLASAWWLTALPGTVVAATVLATNRISRALDGDRA